ncbi:DNA (cytosine-5-)-methyltransferase [Aerococcaceae bacterium DSM 111020]|nr:DNA (cytosine-5-)-methyltransferase [Aerococcaceae bacterium DSM 111020]
MALKNIGVNINLQATVEWEISAIYAYDILHNGPQNLISYRHHTKKSLLSELSKYNISADGKSVSDTLSHLNTHSLKAILAAIERTKNFVDITQVHADALPEDTDLLTYSFPCQDLSIAGRFHFNQGGINRDANNRSTLLWEVERLLFEYQASKKNMPKFLLMENVNAILSEEHRDNFEQWKECLNGFGYINQVWTLDARKFGIPQSRVRTYMLSVKADHKEAKIISNLFENYNLEAYLANDKKMKALSNFLRVDYNNEEYRQEAIDNTPKFTPSRQKIRDMNTVLATGETVHNHEFARTLTTKQDRNPNSGIIKYDSSTKICNTNKYYRNLTPRECLLLMGFSENDFNQLKQNNIEYSSNRKLLSDSKLIKMAGNSIVVDVLEVIFKYMLNIESYVKSHNFVYPIREINMVN